MLAEIGELNTTPGMLGAWLGCLACSLVIAVGVTKLVQAWRGPAPEPPNTLLAGGQSELARRIAVLEGKIDVNEQTSSVKRRELYDHVDLVRKELKADIAAMDEKFDAKMEGLPDKLVLLLKNTGAILRR